MSAWQRGTTSPLAAWRGKEGKDGASTSPDASVPSSFLPFFLPLPLVAYELSITCGNYAWAGPPQVALGSTLG